MIFHSHFPFRDSLSLVDPFPFASIFQTTIYCDIVIGCFYSIDVKNFVAQQKKCRTMSGSKTFVRVFSGCIEWLGGSGPIPPFPNWIKPISRNNVQSPVCNLFITQML